MAAGGPRAGPGPLGSLGWAPGPRGGAAQPRYGNQPPSRAPPPPPVRPLGPGQRVPRAWARPLCPHAATYFHKKAYVLTCVGDELLSKNMLSLVCFCKNVNLGCFVCTIFCIMFQRFFPIPRPPLTPGRQWKNFPATSGPSSHHAQG